MKIDDSTTIDKIFSVIKDKNKEKKAISYKELFEQEGNVLDFKNLLQDLDKQIKIIEAVKNDNNATIEALLFLRLRILDFIWHYDQLDALFLKLIKKYDLEH